MPNSAQNSMPNNAQSDKEAIQTRSTLVLHNAFRGFMAPMNSDLRV